MKLKNDLTIICVPDVDCEQLKFLNNMLKKNPTSIVMNNNCRVFKIEKGKAFEMVTKQQIIKEKTLRDKLNEFANKLFKSKKWTKQVQKRLKRLEE